MIRPAIQYAGNAIQPIVATDSRMRSLSSWKLPRSWFTAYVKFLCVFCVSTEDFETFRTFETIAIAVTC